MKLHGVGRGDPWNDVAAGFIPSTTVALGACLWL